MDLTRRDAVLAGVGMLLAGCASTDTTGHDIRPAPWTVQGYRPSDRPSPTGQVHPITPPPAARAAPATTALGIRILDRRTWTATGANRRRVDPMRGITRITIHHEGWKPVHFSDRGTTAERIELIRTVHTRDRGFGDIGYHYIIDRAGRIWEGRPVTYQGAHVRDHNEHNLGILILGNFDRQRPSSIQLASLEKTLAAMQRTYRIPRQRVHTHQELASTACPGRHLQAVVPGIRRHLT